MNQYRIHLLALPNAQTTKAYSLDGFAMCTMRFAKLMKGLGHHVILYGSEENEAPCDEFVSCISKADQETLLGESEYQHAAIDDRYPLWQMANVKMAIEVKRRKQPKDFLCMIGGASQKYVSDAHKDLMCVEYSIGYEGAFSEYRVYESQIWRHWMHGHQKMGDGRFFDAVIPVFFDPEDFPVCYEPEDYFVYCGRYVTRKGVAIACEASKIAGVKLKCIGHSKECLPTYGENLGGVPAHVRNDVISKAKAVFTPTMYVEPFCCVAVEAQMCGTPVISTDFGGFVETVEHGKTGYRCNYLGEFVQAIKDIDKIDRRYVRHRAVEKYSMQVAAPLYQQYFDRLNLLWNGGWNSLHK